MLDTLKAYHSLLNSLPKEVDLVAVSKTKPISAIEVLYNAGQRDFGENRVQELVEKAEAMSKDIRWHMIGHLQKNKVKYIVPFIHLIHSVDSLDLLTVIEKEARKINREVCVLLQMYIADEETKYGLNEEELNEIILKVRNSDFPHVKICGLMGMATFTEDKNKVRSEFTYLSEQFRKSSDQLNLAHFKILSMGMSGDYLEAIESGSNLIRIGSSLFGSR